jgi:type II secretory pathway component GspD/PulD (secretin)
MKTRAFLPASASLLFLCSLFLPFFFSCTLSAQEQESEQVGHKVFRVINQKASDVEKLVKIFLSPRGMTVSDDRVNTLIVKDYPSVLTKIQGFLIEIDKPLPQVQIIVDFLDTAQCSTSGWGVSAYGANTVWRVGVSALTMNNSIANATSMRLVTMSGTWAEIACGEYAVQPEWFVVYARNGGYLLESVTITQVSTGFAVMPVVRGEEVELTLLPQMSYWADGARKIIRFEKAGATVRVGNGQSAVLSAGNSEQSMVVKRILGSLNASQSGEFTIRVTPQILSR